MKVLNTKLFIISTIIVFLTIFFDKFSNYNYFTHTIGLPIKFLVFYNDTLPANNLFLFSLNNITKINFRIDLFLLSILIVYFILISLIKLYSKLFKNIKTN
ncbi:hypothetical protein SAMN05660242_1224 [Thermoanaerobacterium sp. RBIITD]|nr:hypothetical protein SAMN05660242_1224 [Thermoanaerobacterium sp. RBIITD]